MSQYILFPNNTDFKLVPLENDKSIIKDVTLPIGLFDADLFSKTNNITTLEKILKQIASTKLTRTPDGKVNDNGHILDINFNAAILSICNETYSIKYEQFYESLRKHNVKF